MKLERRVTKILEKLISVPPRLLERLEYHIEYSSALQNFIQS